MSEQFGNPQEAKLEAEIVSDATTEKKIDLVAETAAKKSTKTEQRFDKNNRKLFTK
jgi:hypothetical protein